MLEFCRGLVNQNADMDKLVSGYKKFSAYTNSKMFYPIRIKNSLFV